MALLLLSDVIYVCADINIGLLMLASRPFGNCCVGIRQFQPISETVAVHNKVVLGSVTNKPKRKEKNILIWQKKKDCIHKDIILLGYKCIMHLA